MPPLPRLYGMPCSLFTAKARSYLRKQHLPFAELPVGDPGFGAMSAAAGRFIIPILCDTDGTIVQDTTAIIDHIEASDRVRLPAYPATPVHRAIALIFELFGGEGLLRPAMHYRWGFDAQNLAFLRRDFVAALVPGADTATGDAAFANASRMMRRATAAFGVNEATAPAIEQSYREFLTLLDQHLSAAPYLLGGHPTIGDYGLIGPLFAHLARDPAPSLLMKTQATNVWRWTERMNAPEALLDGLAADESLFADDAAPESLKALLRFVAIDFLPELAAHIGYANDWLDARTDLVAGTNGLDNPAQRSIGFARFDWRDQEISTAVMPYRFWLLQRLQDFVDGLSAGDRARVGALFAETGLEQMVAQRTHRRVERVNHLEVWGPPVR